MDGKKGVATQGKSGTKAIIDPQGLSAFRLVMVIISVCIGGGIFSLSGELAKGANTGAVLLGWAAAFVGVFSLMMCFRGLSRARPDLTGGIYSYAAAGFGRFVGFNAAWGYWFSTCLANVAFALLLFGALSFFFPVFGAGNNIASFIAASALLWVLVFLVSRGIRSATVVTVIITLAKLTPLVMFVAAAILLGKFDPAIFMENFFGDAGTSPVGTQIISTMLALVWVFMGIEVAVAISGRAKYARDVGRATTIAFVAVFLLYFSISFLSLGILPREQMAALPVPALAGIFEHIIGPVGAGAVNLGVSLSLTGATLGYVIISAETPHEAAEKGVFPKAFTKRNKKGAPIVTLLATAGIMQTFIAIAFFAASTYRFFYLMSVYAILVPYLMSTAYYFKIAWQRKRDVDVGLPSRAAARALSAIGLLYTVFLVVSAGLTGLLLATFLFAPGIVVYIVGQRQRKLPLFANGREKALACLIVALMAVAVGLFATGVIVI